MTPKTLKPQHPTQDHSARLLGMTLGNSRGTLEMARGLESTEAFRSGFKVYWDNGKENGSYYNGVI